MLLSIELENFKAFGRRVRIPFAPITLIFGENSSGKSSILQALSLLKQILETKRFVLPRSEETGLDLGSFKEMLFDHDLKREMRLLVAASGGITEEGERIEPGAIEWVFNQTSPKSNAGLQAIELGLGASNSSVARFVPCATPKLSGGMVSNTLYDPYCVPSAEQQWDGDPERDLSTLTWIRCTQASISQEQLSSIFAQVIEAQHLLAKILAREKQLRTATEITSIHNSIPPMNQLEDAISFYSSEFDLQDFTRRINRCQRKAVVGLEGMVPRCCASGHDYLDQAVGQVVGRKIMEIGLPGPSLKDTLPEGALGLASGAIGGEIGLSAILIRAARAAEEALNSLYPLGPLRQPPRRWYPDTGTSPSDVGNRGDLMPDLLLRSTDLVRLVNTWLEKLDIGYELCLRPIRTRYAELFEVRLRDMRRASRVEVGLPDVGYGISKILPFIVQSLISSEKIISIEQPEVHIHPRLQADLGDLLAAAIKRKKANQFLIETHSEHLILRLQRLIRERKLKPDAVSVIFVSRGKEGAKVQRLRLDDEGDFMDNWPGGFFPERLREL
jgi:hypothetical protein